MPINSQLLSNIENNQYKENCLNLSQQNLTDEDIEILAKKLEKNHYIQELNINHNNKLTDKSAKILATNKTLKTLKLKEGNVKITQEGLQAFLKNTTLTKLPFRGRGGALTNEIREHIASNATRVAPRLSQSLPVYSFFIPQNVLPKIDFPAYLEKPVTQKKKTGEGNFIQLATCLSFDLKEFDPDLKIKYAIWFIALTLNLYMHNSSYAPAIGYGKVQDLERDKKLLYYRSQSNHPHRQLHDKVLKKIQAGRGRSLLPRNTAYEKAVGLAALTPGLHTNLEKLDKYGFVKAGKKIELRFGEFLAYSGARTNNISSLIQALNSVAVNQEGQPDLTSLKRILPKVFSKKINALSQQEAAVYIKALTGKFEDLRAKVSFLPKSPKLYSAIHAQRTAQIHEIILAVGNLKNLKIESKENGCLIITLYPNFTDGIKESLNYSEGVTNLIIGFWGGLINHEAAILGLCTQVTRRQSFGFLRSTLTDLGTMRMRLSLGLESPIYVNLIVNSLIKLNEILEIYDFTDRENIKVKKGFETAEKPKGKAATEKTGVRILSAMRSDDDKWKALIESKNYLLYHRSLNPNNYVSDAFGSYFNQFIINRVDFKLQITLPLQTQTKVVANLKENTIFFVLKNTLLYALEYASSFSCGDETDPLLNIKHTYFHSLIKLYKNCDKAIYLLQHASEFEITHLTAKAQLLIENMLEYLIILSAVKKMMDDINEEDLGYTHPLKKRETNYTAQCLNLSAEQINVYFTDSGQQAITASLLEMDINFSDNTRGSIYVFEDSYYELESFLNKIGDLRTYSRSRASVSFIDITHLQQFKRDKFPALKALVIDITNNPCLENALLKNLTTELHQHGIWVILTGSCIKHEELGLDKYQSGKILTLAPKNKTLRKEVIDELSSISRQAMNPFIASYLEMVNEILQEKPTVGQIKENLMNVNLPPSTQQTGLGKNSLFSGFIYQDGKQIPIYEV